MMILKIPTVLCALVLWQVCNIQGSKCNQRNINYGNNQCEVSASEMHVQTSYQGGAVLQVVSGTFTVKLLGNESTAATPKKIYAKDKSIVNVARGFAKIPSLEYLSLEDNFIERIDAFVFEDLPQLVHLSLARNKIRSLVKDSFAGLGKLEVLNLERNALTEFTFSISHNTLPVLRELHLQYNKIAWINENTNAVALICSSNLQYLYLSHNSLTSFNPSGYSGSSCLESLTHLYLEDNRLSDINIVHMSLEALSLDGNRFHSLPRVNRELKFLSLARNYVKFITKYTNDINIACLILSYNDIGNSINNMNNENFLNIPTLEHLDLDSNKISSIPYTFFSNMPSLQSLYLNHNEISYIASESLTDLASLHELFLDSNKLSSFPGKKCFGDSSLSYLDVSNNMIEKVSDLEANMIPKLRFLKLTGNPLKRIEPHTVSRDVEILF